MCACKKVGFNLETNEIFDKKFLQNEPTGLIGISLQVNQTPQLKKQKIHRIS